MGGEQPLATNPSYAPPRDDEEIARIGEVLAHAFLFPVERARAYLERGGLENVRVIRDGGDVQGALLILPMGQWFGERAVPMAGIAAVGIAPDHRGRGAGTRLMRAVVEELHANGTPLSALYPATQPIYRRQGYEQAGMHFEVRLPTDHIHVHDRTLELRPTRPDDQPAIEELYRRSARRAPGNLERHHLIWHRVRESPEDKVQGFCVGRDGQLEGYVYYMQKRASPRWYSLHVTDYVAATPDAGRRLLAFFADHRSLADEVIWRSGPRDPLLMLLPEQRHSRTLQDYWMLRIVNVPAALQARGYAAQLSGELHLEVRDDVLPANGGRFVLEVADGQGHVRSGGRGELQMDVRGLAALYSGFLAPRDLAAAGYAAGSEDAYATAEAIFAGPAPWMRDHF
ncbi:MAG TPA: GNAT family N-acetyltransferase [Phycisphaerae bacterium]